MSLQWEFRGVNGRHCLAIRFTSVAMLKTFEGGQGSAAAGNYSISTTYDFRVRPLEVKVSHGLFRTGAARVMGGQFEVLKNAQPVRRVYR